MTDMTIEEELSVTCEQRDALDIECARLEKEVKALRGLVRECMAADWRSNDNTLWPRLVAATRE